MILSKVKTVPGLVELWIPRKNKFSSPRLAIQFRQNVDFDGKIVDNMQVWPYGQKCQYLPLSATIREFLTNKDINGLKAHLIEVTGVPESVFIA